jgi:putative glutamine amidotransferase
MSAHTPPVRIGVFGSHGIDRDTSRGCGLWSPGYAAVLKAAGAEPVPLEDVSPNLSWGEILEGLQGVVFSGHGSNGQQLAAEEEQFCDWCRTHQFPILSIDEGLHALNASFGGSTYLDLPRDLPDALQHRHPPEKGVRHAINVVPGSRLAQLYGEGEIIVNSEHRRAVCRVARGFRVSARALDGVIEAIEADGDNWFALGVQWHPASASASGLDIQLFRGLVESCGRRQHKPSRAARCLAA